MQTIIALLRAVNVGGTGKLPMADLRALAEAAGFQDVRTYIQSGNLVFSTHNTPDVVKTVLEQKLAAYANKPVSVVVRTAEELRVIQVSNPFPAAEPRKVGVLFLDTAPAADVMDTAKGQSDEQVRLGDREVYIHYPSGMGASRLRLSVTESGTMRNINTVAKLVDMASGDGDPS